MDELQLVAAIGKARKGIAQYLELMELLPAVDVSRDRNFQRKYNAFYRVRQRSIEWYRLYYSFMEQSKLKPPTFDTALRHFYAELGRVESSFSSKLVATLDPEQPIWDRFVLKNTGQKAPSYGAKDRLERTKIVYRNIQKWYKEYLGSEEGKAAVSIFDREVQKHRMLTDLKKIDFILWQIRA